MSTPSAISPESPWWRQATVYQIYPRSFADSDGDGLGDLQGIISHADYLADLGVDAVWLSPFYPSELADGGYDVIDYRDVDPRLGTLADFDQMVDVLHAHGINLVVDIVPNHTSNKHVWFQEALVAGRGSAARERYIFREGKGEDGSLPPSDWVSVFGGPAWTRVEDGQWYLHLFASEQPDLNWDNREVRDEFLKTLKFWSDRGVDGFRIDVAHALTKDLSEPLPSWETLQAMPTASGDHPLFDRDEVQDIYAEWRELFNSYDPPRTAVAEAWVDSSRVPRYASPSSLGQAFNFDLLEADFAADQFASIIRHNLALAERSGSSSTWVLSNHDVVRHATRYGLPNPARKPGHWQPDERHGHRWLLSGGKEPALEREQGLRRARAATMLILGLPGSTYLYQGEELGLHEVAEIPAEERQDPTFFRTGRAEIGRDGCRVPLPWQAEGVSFGFGDASPHLPQPAWFAEHAASEGGKAETLRLYRRALNLRRRLQTEESLEWVDRGDPDVLHLRRPNGWEIITNFGSAPVALSDDEAARIVLRSDPDAAAGAEASTAGTSLPGETTVWLSPTK
ncbi:glycoside hydrolase family 13 protein [Trueperella pecoris]|uniref:glycoside hydrolase family 13 protein n=1 Tax=Trueperella pecoris TaxID=2733571 RepID=UPI001ABEBF89|nr:glycoside hydrolase family 13 protein [Trueperella pecoris]QTG75824.1 glycoside hydrolase family 13 protein [Trueperella pecoris]